MNKNTIVVGILVLLVLVIAVQTFQILGMRDSVQTMEVSGNSVQTISSSSTTSSSGGVPTNLQNLPGMVGGC